MRYLGVDATRPAGLVERLLIGALHNRVCTELDRMEKKRSGS